MPEEGTQIPRPSIEAGITPDFTNTPEQLNALAYKKKRGLFAAFINVISNVVTKM